VVHLAAVVGDPACSREPDAARAINLDASLALIEESQHAGVERFVFASTCSNYGKMKDANQYVMRNPSCLRFPLRRNQSRRGEGTVRERVTTMAGVRHRCGSPQFMEYRRECGSI